jgi:hypothetical protein
VSLRDRLADRLLGPRIPPEQLPHPLPEGVEVRRNGLLPRVGGWLMGSRVAAGAVTLGRTILVPGDRPVRDDLIVHELVHVEQWDRDPLFALKYCAQYLRHGYRRNPYEIEAYARQREHAARTPDMTHPPRNP